MLTRLQIMSPVALKHRFAHVGFCVVSPALNWRKVFLGPHHRRIPSIGDLPVSTAAGVYTGSCIRTFYRIDFEHEIHWIR